MVKADCRNTYKFRKELGGSACPLEPEFLPSGKHKTAAYVLGRVAHLATTDTVRAACARAAKEVCDDWSSKAPVTNQWPKHQNNVTNQLEKMYKDMKALQKLDATRLNSDRAKAKKVPANFGARVSVFNSSMQEILDIETGDANRIKRLKEESDPKRLARKQADADANALALEKEKKRKASDFMASASGNEDSDTTLVLTVRGSRSKTLQKQAAQLLSKSLASNCELAGTASVKRWLELLSSVLLTTESATKIFVASLCPLPTTFSHRTGLWGLTLAR